MRAAVTTLPSRLVAISGLLLAILSVMTGTSQGSVVCIDDDGHTRLAELLHHNHGGALPGRHGGPLSRHAESNDRGQACHGCVDVLIRNPLALSSTGPDADPAAVPATRSETGARQGAGSAAVQHREAVELLQQQRTVVLRL